MKFPFKLQNNNESYYRVTVNTVTNSFQKYFLNPCRFMVIHASSRYRNSVRVQYAVVGVLSLVGGYIISNMATVENREKTFTYTYNLTQYNTLVKQIRSNKKQKMAYETIRDMLEKRHTEEGLSSVEILALNELAKRPELNIHGQYLASLK